MDFSNTPWFTYGLPPSPNESVYGLYEPISDRFFVVHYDIEIVRELALLFSSRYVLHICQLDVASNYSPNLLDNSCCMNWTIGNRDDIKITRTFNYQKIKPITSLVETSAELPWNYANDHSYFMAASCLLESHIPHWRMRHKSALDKYEYHFVDNVPNKPNMNSLLDLISEFRNIVYTEFDFCIAEPLLLNLISKAKHV